MLFYARYETAGLRFFDCFQTRNSFRSSARRARGDFTVMIFIFGKPPLAFGLFYREVQKADADDDDRLDDDQTAGRQEKRGEQSDPEGKDRQPDQFCRAAQIMHSTPPFRPAGFSICAASEKVNQTLRRAAA